MVAYTISPLTSCLPWNRPKLRTAGNNKSFGVGVKPPKSTKVAASWKPDPHKMHDILDGRMVAEGIVFQQELVVRSFDVNGDSKMSLVALANYLQDTSLNHLERIGLLSDGFSTWEMSTRDLIWVFYKMDIAIHRYPCCSESDNSANGNDEGLIEVEHSLRLHNGLELVRGRTLWYPKHPQQLS
ncbi:hypothetical protein V6N13_084021 [Hibiscus sabdariffa]|uniref:Acyl-[acyl-carrier-protein] hydrolase n=1 Tax=Hibiscus sabdariffa TaxID=183260 RepID=A0ABR2T0E2_9ROSI